MDRFDETLRAMAREEDTPVPEGFGARLAGTLAALPPKNRTGGWSLAARYALAACLCVVLMGTALAAVYAAGGFRSIQVNGSRGYTLQGGERRYVPLSSLSQEVLDLSEPVKTVSRAFSSLAEAERFCGVTLPRDPVLDGLEDTACTLEVSAGPNGPNCLYFSHHGVTAAGQSVQARVWLLTENMEDGQDGFTVKKSYAPGVAGSFESYTASNGLTAFVTRVDRTWDKDVKYTADLLVDGVQYTILVWGVTPEEVSGTLRGVLDGFQVE